MAFRFKWLTVATLGATVAAFSPLSALAQTPASESSDSATSPSTAGGGAGRGEGRRAAGMMAGNPVIRVAESLTDLTPEQKTKLDEIKKSNTQKLQALRAEAGITTATGGARPDPEAFRALRPKMNELQKTTREEVMGILTDAQKTQVEEKVKEAAARRGNRGGGNRGDSASTASATGASSSSSSSASSSGSSE